MPTGSHAAMHCARIADILGLLGAVVVPPLYLGKGEKEGVIDDETREEFRNSRHPFLYLFFLYSRIDADVGTGELEEPAHATRLE